jgi:transcriptional regulator with XRE-family HTH domain
MATSPPPPSDDSLEAAGIANALIKARSALGLTQVQLSDLSGISRSAIKAYETGRNMPGSRELKALCKALRLSPNVLLFGTDQPFADKALGGEDGPALRLILTDPEDAKRARLRLLVLAELLSGDELASLLNIINALAIARHGADVVERRAQSADLLAAMGVAFQNDIRRVAEGAAAPDAAKMVADVEDSMARGGHRKKD